MTKQTEALKLALRSIRELVLDESDDAPALQGARMRKQKAEKAIREALAEQELVFSFKMQLKPGWGSQYPSPCVIGDPDLRSLFSKVGDVVTFYTSPPAQRKPLTDEEIEALLPNPDGTAEVDSVRVLVAPGLYGTEYTEADAWTKESIIQVARAIEAAHGIKGDA